MTGHADSNIVAALASQSHCNYRHYGFGIQFHTVLKQVTTCFGPARCVLSVQQTPGLFPRANYSSYSD
jgi:hypothetical protein